MPVSPPAIPNTFSFWESLFHTYTSSTKNPKPHPRTCAMPISKRSTHPHAEKARKLPTGAAPPASSPQIPPYRRATIQAENPSARGVNKRSGAAHAIHPPHAFGSPFNGVASPPDTPGITPATTAQPVQVCEHPLSNGFPPNGEPVNLNSAMIASLQSQNAALMHRLDEKAEIIQSLRDSQAALIERNEYLSKQTESLKNELKGLYHRFENVKNKANILLADSTRDITDLTAAKCQLEGIIGQLQLQLAQQSKVSAAAVDLEIARDIDRRQTVSLDEFLQFIYVRYPPPQPIPNFNRTPGRAEVVDAIRKYHPDKLGRFGERVRHMAEEVTKGLSRRLEQYR
ncbi:hypothetical protein NEOLI_001533 [Neolecta irregularis DAH-3]|uniref:Uncharacterized protein n=1 Tax=Neolecta irregularis (strain DAH-3) TaxID=1198029 RepID=A0A1U7LUV4_NEOID|nr:hypothetical protein NEOLI_001533 [Neolecta irregularis DAH-3]|eukprot:OLL26398.1 hypothetical protein NEOLI_001533 [Neolecta irregularis DAH-3]